LNYKNNNSYLFIFYLVLLVWAPLPLGSNRVWALSILELGIFLLAFTWMMLYFFNKVSVNVTFLAARIPLLIFALFTLYVLLQSIPLPIAMVQWLAPDIAHSYKALAIVNGEPINTAYLSRVILCQDL